MLRTRTFIKLRFLARNLHFLKHKYSSTASNIRNFTDKMLNSYWYFFMFICIYFVYCFVIVYPFIIVCLQAIFFLHYLAPTKLYSSLLVEITYFARIQPFNHYLSAPKCCHYDYVTMQGIHLIARVAYNRYFNLITYIYCRCVASEFCKYYSQFPVYRTPVT